MEPRQALSDWLTQGFGEHKNNAELCNSLGLCPCLPFFYSKSWILWMVLHFARNNPCLLLNQNRKVTVLVLGGVYRDTGGLIHRDAGGLMLRLYTPALCRWCSSQDSFHGSDRYTCNLDDPVSTGRQSFILCLITNGDQFLYRWL